MRVLVVIWSVQIGGAETFAVELCKFLNDRGHKTYLFPVSGSWDKDYYLHITSAGVNVLSPFSNFVWNWMAWKINAVFQKLNWYPFRDRITSLFFKSAIKKRNIDIVISNSLISDVFVAEHLSNKVPHIAVEHGEYSSSIVENRSVNWNGIRHAREIVCVSEWCRTMIGSRINAPLTVIHNGHRSQRDNSANILEIEIQSHEFVFGMIGRGVSSKGWHEAIKAFEIVKQHHSESRLILVGDGELLDDLRNLYGPESGIVFTGRLINPGVAVRKIHVGLVPSKKFEAFGLSVLDFFSQGKPIIASNLGGLPEVVNFKDKSGGILVPLDENGNANITILADRMLMMIHDKKYYAERAEDAASIYKHFAFEVAGMKYERILKKYVND